MGNKFVICRQTAYNKPGFDYLEEFTSDGRFSFTDEFLHACVIPDFAISSALLWCEVFSPTTFFFVMALEGANVG